MRKVLGWIILTMFSASAVLAAEEMRTMPTLEEELAKTRDLLFAARTPRATLDDMDDYTREELARRESIIRNTWTNFMRGISDADTHLSNGVVRLKGYAPLNPVELAYVEALKKEMGIEFDHAQKEIHDIQEWMYVYGFNSRMQGVIERKHGKFTCSSILGEVVKRAGYNTFIARSFYFVPFPFAITNTNVTPLYESVWPGQRSMMPGSK